ncbi:MAG: HAMP domain-containing protein [Acidobacteria bacterium]|nr:HAMP domain-containing protein [Acidobacteriota bacterium]
MTDPKAAPKTDLRMRPSFIIAASVIVLGLAVSVFGLTSLRLPFISPADSSEIIVLFALSAIIFLALVIFGFILFRSLFKLYLERQANQLGSKFKTKLVVGAIGLSVLPVFFLFLFSYSLINRTLDKWFSRPFETVSLDARYVAAGLDRIARRSAEAEADRLAASLMSVGGPPQRLQSELQREFPDLSRYGLDYIGVVDPDRKVVAEQTSDPSLAGLPVQYPAGVGPASAEPRGAGPSRIVGSKLVSRNGSTYVLARADMSMDSASRAVWVAMKLPTNLFDSVDRLNQESQSYGELSQYRKLVRQTYLAILLLLTVLILFIATWFALFLSRQVTVPIQALAEATHEISRGNLDYRVHTRAADELGILVRSFNEMTAQLAAGRAELERSRNHLEQAHFQLDQKHRFTEAILESIPTGVITVTGQGIILADNPAARRLFGCETIVAAQLSSLFSQEDSRELHHLLKRAARLGQATRHLETQINGRVMHLAITVSALPGDPPPKAGAAASGWFVVVLEDMSDLLQAQKAAAWGEVAQRVAHEIKNPLTPIALSAERIRMWLERQGGVRQGSPELNRVVQESCSLIQHEVETLKRLVDEFAQFARFPQARPEPVNLNQIVEKALGAFNGRLEGIHIVTHLDPDLPPVMVDADQFRRVVVNLMDNAADAMENSLVKEIVIATRSDPQRAVVEAEISDTGCGVSPEDKEKLFLPYFSTKERGTGLGLAIVNRIVAEHRGTIRVEENEPLGTRFVVELPWKSS